MYVRLAANLQPDSIVDGDGIRTVIWFQGCRHNCLGCHNPQSHDLNGGFQVDIDELVNEVLSLKYQNGVTLSGGDPFFQPVECLYLCKKLKEHNINIWCYTGFTYEALVKKSESDNVIGEILSNIDVLIDGKFELDKKSLNFKFRGSSNQRIIDLKRTKEEGKLILKY